jgi:hypothetical protein
MASDAVIRAYSFERYVLDVAIATLKHGITTSNIDSYQFLEPVDAWGFPKYPGRTAIVPPEEDLVIALKSFIFDNGSYLREPDTWLGTWINPQTDHYYLDITMSYQDFDEAKRIAIEIGVKDGRRIVALYNSRRQETVYL